MIPTLTGYAVVSWLVIEVFDILAPTFALPAWVNLAVTVALLAGFPVAAYLSWVFDISSSGITRTLDESGSKPHPLQPWHWLGLLVIAVSAGTVGTLLFQDVNARLQKLDEGIETVSIEQSIAIVPFTDLSANEDQRYFAEGVAAEIASLLGQAPDLRTASSSASFRLADEGLSPQDVGQQLGVASVLSGSVNAAGNRLRVRAELINAGNGEVLWSDTFTRTLDDVFALERNIARSIANVLLDEYVDGSQFGPIPRTSNSDAYVFYLKGKSELRLRNAESVKAARKLFEQSVALDPDFAPALVGLADTLWLQAEGVENYGSIDAEVAAKAARENVERALVINDRLPEAYATLGRIEAILQNHTEAITYYDKAISINQSLFDVHLWRHFSLNKLGRFSESLEALNKALSLDPTSPVALHNLGQEKSKRGDYAGARNQFLRLIDLYPNNPMGYRGLADAAFRQGELALSLEQWDRAAELWPDTPLYQDSFQSVLYALKLVEPLRPLAIASGDEVSLLEIQGKFDELKIAMDLKLALNPEDPWLQFEAAWYRLLAGDFNEGVALLLSADQLFSQAEIFELPMCSPAIEFALALRKQGMTNEADDYIERCEALVRTARRNVYEDSFLDHLESRIAALRGEKSRAVVMMDAAFTHGWREWWTRFDPILRDLSSEPGMDAVFTSI